MVVSLAATAPRLAAAVAVTVSPAAVMSDYTGTVSLSITGLSVGKTVIIERFVDFNGDGVINAGDLLSLKVKVTDGSAPKIGGVRNANVPGDDDGSPNGAIRVDLPFPGLDGVFNSIGVKFIFRVSDAQTGFGLGLAAFQVTQKSQAQGVSGTITAASGGAPLPGTIIVLNPVSGRTVAATLTDVNGHYSLFSPPGAFQVVAVKNGFVSDQNAANVTVLANQIATTNLAMVSAGFTVSGRLSDSSNGAGLGGVSVSARSTDDQFFAFGFADRNGNYSFGLTAGEWQIKLSENQLAQLGYVRPQKLTVTTPASGSTTVNLAAPRATALIHGTVKDLANTPVLQLGTSAGGKGSLFDTAGVSFSPAGNYSLGVLAGKWFVGPQMDDLSERAYIGQDTEVTVSAGQEIVTPLVVQSATAHMRGHIQDDHGLPIAFTGITVNSNNDNNTSTRPATDGSGNFDAPVVNGDWEISLDCKAQRKGFVNVFGYDFTVTGDRNNLLLTFPVATATITGSVVDNAGHPIVGAELSADQPGAGNLTYNQGCASTDINGNYTLKVIGGSWDVSVDSDSLQTRGFDVVSPQNVTIVGGTATGNFVATQLPPAITSPLTATATVGQLFVYQITGKSNPDSFSASPLPAGLSCNNAQGIIAGIPTTAGTTQVALGATNSAGTGNETLALTVQPAPAGPLIVSSTTATGRTGQPFSFRVLTQNTTSSAVLSADDLPPGLSLEPSNGLISGTPTSDDSFIVQLTVTDGAATTNATLQLTFTSDPALPVVTCNGECSDGGVTLIEGQPFSYTLTADAAADFSYIGTDGLPNGALPPGLGYDPSSHTISGVYTGGANASSGKGSIKPHTITIRPPLVRAVCQIVAVGAPGNIGTGPLNFLADPGFAFSFEPTDVEVEATGPNGAVATFPIPTATDKNDNPVPVTCDATSGAVFPLGQTVVTCTGETNDGLTGSASFNVTVQDTKPPVITAIPTQITVGQQKAAKGKPKGARVNFATQLSASDVVDGTVTPTANPPSGSFFKFGTTRVTVIAADGRGNTSQPPKMFSVKVTSTAPKTTPSTARVSAGTTPINEGASTSFNISVSPANPARPVVVNFQMSGAAPAQYYTLTDFAGQPIQLTSSNIGRVTVPAGSRSATVNVNSISNGQTSGSEAVTMTLQSGAGYTFGKATKGKPVPPPVATITINNLP